MENSEYDALKVMNIPAFQTTQNVLLHHVVAGRGTLC